MNACQKCEAGYLHKYNGGIKWDECVQIKPNKKGLEKCLSYQVYDSNSIEGQCKICQRGYVLNKDKYCEQIIAPNCNYGRFEDNEYTIQRKENTAYALYVFQNGYGCTQCKEGYISYPSDAMNI